VKSRRSSLQALASLWGLALGACATPHVVLADRGLPIAPEQYEAMVDRWSRDGEVLDWGAGLESRLAVTATFFSKEFRRAYVARFAQAAATPDAERQRMLAASLRAADVEHEFFVALVAQYPRWGQLDRPTSAWRIRLVDEQGREHAPSRIERSRQATPLDRAMFHYWTPWRVVFRVHFNALDAEGRPILPPNTRRFLLRFAGPYGTADLRWDVRSP
jgi:hypothetical protein